MSVGEPRVIFIRWLAIAVGGTLVAAPIAALLAITFLG